MTGPRSESASDESIPTLKDIEDAAAAFPKQRDERDRQVIVRTPTLYSRVLSDDVDMKLREEDRGIQIYVKHENMQVTAAYKERGALTKLLQLRGADGRARVKGVVAASAGNHAQGLAIHALRLGIPATIFMPEGTPTLKVARTKQHKATVKIEGANFDQCKEIALGYARENGLEFVDPFDDPAVIAGQGTVALEMLDDVLAGTDKRPLETLIVPIGGGGLISGMAIAAKARDPSITIIGVEAALFPTMYNMRHGLEDFPGGATIAEGIAVRHPGKLTGKIVNARNADGAYQYVDDILLVEEMWIEEAIGRLFELEKTVVEGAGAAGFAALLQYAKGPKFSHYFRKRKVGIVLTGGNIDTRLFSNILVRDLLIENRMARINVVLKDEPGQLLKVLEVLRDKRINVVDIAQERRFNRLLAKNVGAEIDCEADREEAFDEAVAALEKEGFEAERVLVTKDLRAQSR
jgi:threonine dehydratase